MRDRTHDEFIEKWANFVKENPISVWKPHIKNLVDSQIIIANRFYSRLSKTKEGREKLKLLRK
ncbi:MAG: hypothetical protein KJ623_00480 [Nanoarchaeota archaeon]|nr:hypothetical protein [Nanoarchaeota archaeon]MBU0962375.1 hypothetical protein [Nanoarchaeota archaeon]